MENIPYNASQKQFKVYASAEALKKFNYTMSEIPLEEPDKKRKSKSVMENGFLMTRENAFIFNLKFF